MKRYRKLSPTLARRLLSLAVVLCFCAMLMPLPFAPLRSNTQEKDQSQPFPCQNRPCGCRSAEQCWKKCCCFNNSQKIAWAKTHKVTVPDYVQVAAEKEKLTSVEVCSLPTKKTPIDDAIKSKRGCSRCQKPSIGESLLGCVENCSRSEASNVRQPAKSRCCERKPAALRADASRGEAAKAITRQDRSSKWVMAVYSAECQGQGPNVYCSIVLVIPNSQAVKPAMPEMIETFSIESERLLSASLRPPLPPPKIGETSFCA